MLGSITYICTVIALASSILSISRFFHLDQGLSTIGISVLAATGALVMTISTVRGARWSVIIIVCCGLISFLHLYKLPLPWPGFLIWGINVIFCVFSYGLLTRLVKVSDEISYDQNT